MKTSTKSNAAIPVKFMTNYYCLVPSIKGKLIKQLNVTIITSTAKASDNYMAMLKVMSHCNRC